MKHASGPVKSHSGNFLIGRCGTVGTIFWNFEEHFKFGAVCMHVNTFFVLNALSANKKMMIYGEE